MTDIKLRAWTGSSMVHFKLENIDGGAIITGDSNDNEESGWTHLNDIKVQMYTGLKDINNIEIYGGDIVKISKLDGKYPQIYEVEWRDIGMSGFRLIDVKREGDEFGVYTRNIGMRSDRIEVIGNIYQN